MAFEFPDIDPVALSLGPVEIRWYALAYLAAFLLGWQYCLYLAGLDKERRPHKSDIDDFLPWVILGVILGGRLGYVLFYQPAHYLANPVEIPQIWLGGMAFHGGLLGAIVAMVAFAVYQKISALRLADMVACAVPIGLFFGRIANFINGELFGRTTKAPWGVEFPHGGVLPRHPSQLYEAALEGLLLFVILWGMARMPRFRDRPGLLSGVFLTGYALARMFAEQYREPDAHIGLLFGQFTMGQLLSVPMALGGIILIGYALRRTKESKGGNSGESAV